MDQNITNSSEETEKYGELFAKRVKAQDVIYLIGNLGSGKTTFVKGLARALGVKSRIISPTFIIERRHEVKSEISSSNELKINGIKRLYHLDLYRLKDEKEITNLDMEEILSDKEGITIIEWPELGNKIINKKTWKIQFVYLENNSRKITTNYE